MRADDVWHYRKKSWMVPLEISFRLWTIGHDHLHTWPKTMKFLTFFVSDWNLLLLIPKPWLQPLFEVLLHFVFFFCPSKNLGSVIIKTICFNSQCGNYRIFLSLRFYVKLNFGDFRSAKYAILTHLEALNFDFHDFLHFENAEIDQKSKLRISKIAKSGIFYF